MIAVHIASYCDTALISFMDVNDESVTFFELSKRVNTIVSLLGFLSSNKKKIIGYNMEGFNCILLNYLQKNYLRISGESGSIIAFQLYSLKKQIEIGDYDKRLKYTNYYNYIDLMKVNANVDEKVSLIHLMSINMYDIDFGYINEDNLSKTEMDKVKAISIKFLNFICNMAEQSIDLINQRFELSKYYGVDVINKFSQGIGSSIIDESLCIKHGCSRQELEEQFKEPNPFCDIFSSFEPILGFSYKDQSMNLLYKNICETKITDQGAIIEGEFKIEGRRVCINEGGIKYYEKGVHHDSESEMMIYVDVRHMYPTIICNNKLFSDKTVKVALPIMKSFVKKRNEAYKNNDKDGINTYKLPMLGVYGKLKSKNSLLFDSVSYYLTNTLAKLHMMKLIDELICLDSKIICVNNDEVIFKISSNNKVELKKIIKEWEKQSSLKLKVKLLKTIGILNESNYFIKDSDFNISSKGLFAFDNFKFGKRTNAPIVAKSVVYNILNEEPIQSIIKNCKDFSMFISCFKSNRLFSVYYKDNIINNTYRVYASNNNGRISIVNNLKLSKQIKENVSLINGSIPDISDIKDLNYAYYIKAALALKEELVPSQLTLF